jgi:hypothetical protein
MSTRQLSETITNPSLRSVNFFNGRLLTAEDLGQEQAIRRAADARIGQAVGSGIAYGLEVAQAASSPAQPAVTIQPGLAINLKGQAMSLSDAVDVSLVRPATAGTPAPSGVFSDCQPPQPGIYVAAAGVYLLVMCPASATEGRAPVNGLGTCTVACNARYNIEGVQFRLVQLPTAADLTQPARLRNTVAYECFGTIGDTAAFVSDPFNAPWDRTGLLDLMRRNKIGIGDCDVPLAVIYWTLDGIQFVDMWSVRRRLTEQTAIHSWPLLFSDRRVSETDAMFQQFEDQIETIFTAESGLENIQATDRFTFLPPVGLLPMRGAGSPKGFDAGMFFGNQSSRAIATMDGASLRSLFADARDHEPIDLRSAAKVQLYVTFENLIAVRNRQSSQLAVIFASRYLTNRETARYSFASFELGCFASNFVR